jgi:hypothetical protein
MEGFKLRSKLLKTKLTKPEVETLIEELNKIRIINLEDLASLDTQSILSLNVKPRVRTILWQCAKKHSGTQLFLQYWSPFQAGGFYMEAPPCIMAVLQAYIPLLASNPEQKLTITYLSILFSRNLPFEGPVRRNKLVSNSRRHTSVCQRRLRSCGLLHASRAWFEALEGLLARLC